MLKHIKNSKGLSLIELLVATVVSSILLMMLMQLVVLNVQTRRVTEYENFVTDQALDITETIQNRLVELQPQGVSIDDGVSDPNLIEITFHHWYDVRINAVDGTLERYTDNAEDVVLVYNISAETLTLEGNVIHASSVKISTGSDLIVDYYEDTSPDPLTCQDDLLQWEDRICKDGVVYLNLEIVIEFDNGERGEVFTFQTQIIV